MAFHAAAFVLSAASAPTSAPLRAAGAASLLSPLRASRWPHAPLRRRRCARCAPPRPAPAPVLVMRHYRRNSSAGRRTAPKSLANLSHTIRDAWRNASSNERFAIVVATLAALAFAGTVLNVVFSLSIFLAVTVVSLIAAPLLFLVMLSFTAFIAGILMTTGFAYAVFGAPIFTVALMTKMLLPVLAIGAGASYAVTRLLRIAAPRRRATPRPTADFERPPEADTPVDQFERFDDILSARVSGSRARNAETWALNDVIDELDISGLGEYRQLFIQERIDGHALLNLSDDDIRAEFAPTMPLGDRMRLMRLVARLRKRSSRL